MPEEVSPPESPATDNVSVVHVPTPVDEKEDTPVTQPESEPALDWEYRNQQRVVLYEALTARVGHRDALLWQPPALALTAQAFLLTIALGNESSPIARFLAACLGLWVTYLSVQLMLKHRLYLWNDMVTMVALERRMKVPTSAIDYKTQLAFVEGDEDLAGTMKEKNGVTKYTSVHVWIWGLGFFAVVNLFLAVFAALDMFGVPCADWLGGNSKCVVQL